MRSKFAQTTLGERKSSEYGTPLGFFKTLNHIFNFKLDPCALETEPHRLGTERAYTKVDDGLSLPWNVNTFCNPPFGTKKGEKVGDWIRKFKQSVEEYPDNIYVMLLPTRLESNWFQNLIWPEFQLHVYVVRGRLAFYNPKTNSNNDPHPIGSMLIIGCAAPTNLIEPIAQLRKLIPGIILQRGLTRQ